MSAAPLPPDTHLGRIRLRVSDLSRAVQFYSEALGFTVVSDDGGTAVLGTGPDEALLMLH